MKISPRSLLTFSLLLGLGLTPACSGSGSSPGDGGAGAGGTTGAAGSGGTTGAAGSGAAGSGAAGSGGASASGGATGAAGATAGPTACAYSLMGGRTDPTTNAPFSCANGKIEQVSGQGDFTASIGAGFLSARGDTVALACTLSSPTPPAAGTKWTLSKTAHSQGNCQLTVIKGSTATLWGAASNDASLSGALELTFTNVTMVHGTAHPMDVYYLYDLTLTATLPGMTAGATDVTVAGSFKNMSLPLGS